MRKKEGITEELIEIHQKVNDYFKNLNVETKYIEDLKTKPKKKK